MQIFVVLRNGQALFGMPHIETLDILRIICNTTGMETQNEHTYCQVEDRCQYTNTQETEKSEKYSTSTTSIPNSNNRDKPMIINNLNSKIIYYIPGSSHKAEKRQVLKFCTNYIESSKMYSLGLGALIKHSYYR